MQNTDLLGGRNIVAWELFRDTADPGSFIEYFIDASWVEQMRQHDRVTGYDIMLRDKKAKFHLEDTPPAISHYFA